MNRFLFVFFVSLTLLSSQICEAQQTNGVGTNNWFNGPVGLQMYSLREVCKNDMAAGMKQAAAMGFKYVEASSRYDLSAKQYKQLLDESGLTATAWLTDFGAWENNLEATVADVKDLGIRYAGCAWLPHNQTFTEADARRAAAVFNKAGAALKKVGAKFIYHNHGYEFYPYKDGKTMFDLLVELSDPETVCFEMDVMWTVFPGQDPVQLLKKYGTRFRLFHMKDIKKGVEGNLSGGTSVENDVALCTGQVNFPALLKAAQDVGIEYYFIEDESPRVPDQILQSLKNLENLNP